ncbi:hypothetical protein TIFTF001_012137 [Ficus carica]|uniref:Uncharacterized protein n=1 Tax=Ficus carica TaxID=3494 RepID=A0AA88A169_FICCA|nr:hypothetical protein TIFTF001_012137 [Ficus carica]
MNLHQEKHLPCQWVANGLHEYRILLTEPFGDTANPKQEGSKSTKKGKYVKQ